MKEIAEAVDMLRLEMARDPAIAKTKDRLVLEWIVRNIVGSHKMRMPAYCDVGCDTNSIKDWSLVKLPYPVITLYYEAPDETPPFGVMSVLLDVSLVRELFLKLGGSTFLNSIPSEKLQAYLEDTPGGFYMITMQRTRDGWSPPCVMVKIEPDSFKDDNVVESGVLPLLSNYGAATGLILEDSNGLDVEPSLAIASMQGSTKIVGALACLNARNIHSVCIPPSKVGNQMRLAKNKSPVYEYHVLDIFLKPELRKLARTNPNQVRPIVDQALSKGVPLHTVRGHFKQRKTGLFWWSSFIRGRAENGAVVKDYNVRL